MGGEEVESYDTAAEMALASDIVAVGSFQDFRVSRTIQGDAAEDVLIYIGATFVPSNVIAGEPGHDVIVVEFISPSPNTDATLSEVNDAADKEVLVFLRNKGGAEDGLYRLVNSAGLWEESNDQLVAPLHEAFGPSDADGQKPFRPSIVSDFTTRSTIDEIVAHLES